MEIKLSIDATQLTRTGDAVARPIRPDAVDTPVSFQESRDLEQRLEALPDVRPGAVERGRALISLAQYPPTEMMHKIARLLAIGSDDSQAQP